MELEQAIEEFLERHPGTEVVFIENFSMGALYDRKRNALYLKEGIFGQKKKNLKKT